MMEFTYLKDKVNRKRLLIAKHEKELQILLSKCTHEVTEPKSKYYSGSYLDQASTDYWDECVICGKQFNKTSTTHSWYG